MSIILRVVCIKTRRRHVVIVPFFEMGAEG